MSGHRFSLSPLYVSELRRFLDRANYRIPHFVNAYGCKIQSFKFRSAGGKINSLNFDAPGTATNLSNINTWVNEWLVNREGR